MLESLLRAAQQLAASDIHLSAGMPPLARVCGALQTLEPDTLGNAPIRGIIDFIAAQAEYTPPIIYSKGSREKLVFRIEAAPDPQQAPTLNPGLPVDVRLTDK